MTRVLIIAAASAVVSLSAQGPDIAADYFLPREKIDSSFEWDGGASCVFRDRIGIVLRSDWQNRHWVKTNGKQFELNGQAEVTAKGWHQTFKSRNITVGLDLLRGRESGDNVEFSGTIVISRVGRATEYRVEGGCGA
jgi:hypothetical protein